MHLTGARKVLGHYYGSIVYFDICAQKQLMKMYGEVAMAMTVKWFPKSAFKMTDKVVGEILLSG